MTAHPPVRGPLTKGIPQLPAQPLSTKGRQVFPLTKRMANPDLLLTKGGIFLLQPGLKDLSHTGGCNCSPQFKVAVGWYNTIRLVGRVPDAHVKALQRLTSLGFKLVLISFCGKARAEEVRQEASALSVEWDDLCFTREKAGRGGKLEACLGLRCGQIIDDDEEVLWECHQNNFKHYPIRANKKPHSWANETYRDLPAAVDALLRSHGIR